MNRVGVAIGLDVGARRIGVARGDSEVKIASPLAPVFNDGEALDQLTRVITSSNAETVVVGLPRNSEGAETEQSRYTRNFVHDLAETLVNASCEARIVFQDESLTSIQAEDRLKHGHHYDDKMLRDGTLDSEAAVIILQDYLEAPHD